MAVIYYAQNAETQANEDNYRAAIADAEAANGIPAGLLHRQIFQESHFRSDIISGQTVSGGGAVGIAQIIPRFHPGVDVYDPYASIAYAGQYMRRLFNRFGSWKLALAAYNAGASNVDKYGGVPPFKETQKYVAEITADVEVA